MLDVLKPQHLQISSCIPLMLILSMILTLLYRHLEADEQDAAVAWAEIPESVAPEMHKYLELSQQGKKL